MGEPSGDVSSNGKGNTSTTTTATSSNKASPINGVDPVGARLLREFEGVDPSVPDPLHPGLSTDYRKPGSAVFGVAAQSRFTHPENIPGVKGSSNTSSDGAGSGGLDVGGGGVGGGGGSGKDWRVESSRARIARTEGAVVKMPAGLEAFEPKLYHR